MDITNNNQFKAFLDITENRSRILAMIVVMVHDFELAEDLFQETVLEIMKSQDTFDTTRCFASWACGIAKNVVRRYWRNQKIHPSGGYCEMVADMALVSTEGGDDAWHYERIALRRCLQKVPSRMRKLLMLRYGHNYKGSKLAEMASYRQGSIRTTLARLRSQLRQCIEIQTIQNRGER